MSRLMRPCLGCKRSVRGKTRCRDCQARLDKRKAQRRPDLHNDAAERRRRAAVVADHRLIVGDWCPGWGARPAHPSADLTADHVKEVAAGGHVTGRLVVRCRSCNSAKANAILARALDAVRSPRLRPIASTAALGPPGLSPEQQSGGALGPGHERAPGSDLPAAPMSVSPQGGQPATPRPSKFPTESAPPPKSAHAPDFGPVVG